jgi:general secretion pathway protein G
VIGVQPEQERPVPDVAVHGGAGEGRGRRAVVRAGIVLAAVTAGTLLFALDFAEVGAGPRASIAATKASMRTIVAGIQGFRADRGTYPANVQALVASRFLARSPTDSWGRPFIYATPGPAGRAFALISLGPDGTQGTDDDIDWWRVEQE